MVIKEKSIKNYTVLERTLRYILSKEITEGFVQTRFIRGDRRYKKQLEAHLEDQQAQSIILERRLQNMLEQYKTNDKQRIHKRQKETKFHHSIISFSKKDVLSHDDLLKTAKQFIKERYPKSIVCAVSHHDTEHAHIHLVGSHVQVGNGITNYHTKKQFSAIKQRMERWQELELNLEYSSVEHVKKKTKALLRRLSSK